MDRLEEQPTTTSSVPARLFSPIRRSQTSAELADHLAAVILEGHLEAGTRLTSERELMEATGLGRATVRDALKLLESLGLVAVRVGAQGGAYVTVPDVDFVVDGLADILLMSQVEPATVADAWRTCELGSIALACERATPADIEFLTNSCDRASEALASETYDHVMAIGFHTELAQRTHNPAIALILESFHTSFLTTTVDPVTVTRDVWETSIAEHRAIVRAVEGRDSARARRLMGGHLERVTRLPGGLLGAAVQLNGTQGA